MSGQTDPSASTDEMVTRVEVIDHIGEAFTGDPLTRFDLQNVARRHGARSAVIDLLGQLPDRRFIRPHELWNDLRDVPIEH
jgi:hypothetical protein